MKIRKPVNELTLDDIRKFSVWEYALDEETENGQDETTVRPCEISDALDPSDVIIRARFVLADGTQMFGTLQTPFLGDDRLGRLQPVIITNRGHVLFWHGIFAPKAAEVALSYEMLGKDAARVFPIQFISDVELGGAPIRGSIPGFMFLKDKEMLTIL
jgi:hypothetical protein